MSATSQQVLAFGRRLTAAATRGFREAMTLAWFFLIYVLSLWTAIGTLGSFQLQHSRERGFEQLQREYNNLSGNAYLDGSADAIELIQRRDDLRFQIDQLERSTSVATFINDFVTPNREFAERAVSYNYQNFWFPNARLVADYCREFGRFEEDEQQLSLIVDNCRNFQPLRDLLMRYDQADYEIFEFSEARWQEWHDKNPGAESLIFFVEGLGFEPFATMPREALVLFLTMAMGLLGSVLRLTWMKLRPSPAEMLNFFRCLLIPAVGIVSALVIYITLKGGQMVITAGDAADPLDPFFLSFVGIISGVLSDEANTRVQSLGRRFFQSAETDISRWAVNVRSALDEQGIEIARLARDIGMAEADLVRIVAEDQPADPIEQRLIASYLRTPQRELFSDLRPEEATAAPPDTPRNEVVSL